MNLRTQRPWISTHQVTKHNLPKTLVSSSHPKQSLREEVWTALEKSGDERFPGARGRIPNFTGRDEAARRLYKQTAYQEADRIKINPDSPQTPVRKQALEDGKTLYMAVPRLKDPKCFLELDPDTIDGSPSDASTIKGANRHGQPIHPENMDPVDLIVTGVVGTDPDGRRLGKGEGYSDLEFAILLEYDRIYRKVPIASTLHPVQELDWGRIPDESLDISLSQYHTPERSVNVDNPASRPKGLKPNRLTDEQRENIPVLRDLLHERT